MPFIPTATSGISFRRELLSKILPMPLAEGVVLMDNYIKYFAIASSIGYFGGNELAVQRIHGLNAYTQSNNKKLNGKVQVATALALEENCPELHEFNKQLLTSGLACSLRHHSFDEGLREPLRAFLSGCTLFETEGMGLKIAYSILRSYISSLVQLVQRYMHE